LRKNGGSTFRTNARIYFFRTDILRITTGHYNEARTAIKKLQEKEISTERKENENERNGGNGQKKVKR
jgi:hypothetical protein